MAYGQLQFAAPAATGGFTTQFIDAMWSVGQALAMKLDAAGAAHVAYLSDAPFGLGGHHRRDDGADALVRRAGRGRLEHRERRHGGHSRQSGAGDSSRSGAVGVAYQAATKLVWARRQGPWNWTFASVDGTAGNGEFASAAFDAAGHGFVSYFDWPNGDSKLATNATGTWQTSVVDSAGVTGAGTSLALDATGAPRIAYYDQTNTRLRYAFATGSTWTLEVADVLAGADVGQYPSLALDASGVAHAAYFDATEVWIRYASRDPAGRAQTASPWSGWSTSLALGPDGSPASPPSTTPSTARRPPDSARRERSTSPGRTASGWCHARRGRHPAPYPVALAVDALDCPRIATPNLVLSYVP